MLVIFSGTHSQIIHVVLKDGVYSEWIKKSTDDNEKPSTVCYVLLIAVLFFTFNDLLSELLAIEYFLRNQEKPLKIYTTIDIFF